MPIRPVVKSGRLLTYGVQNSWSERFRTCDLRETETAVRARQCGLFRSL